MSAHPFERARIGGTRVEVTRLGLGTAPLGGWPRRVPYDVGVATVRRAWEAGVRYFDTAPFYGSGLAELFLGEILGDRPRREFALSTKVGRRLLRGGEADPLYEGGLPFTPVFDYSRTAVEESLCGSSGRLGIEQPDIALIHDPDDHHGEALAEAYPALADARAEGRLGAIGVGMTRSAPLARFAEEADFDCMMIAGRYTLLEQGALDDLLPVATARGLSVIAGGVLNSGLLATAQAGAHYDYRPADEAVLTRAVRLDAVCHEFGIPLRAAAMQFPLAHPAVACVVIGARTPAEVDDSVGMCEMDIPPELWSALRERALIRGDAPVPP